MAKPTRREYQNQKGRKRRGGGFRTFLGVMLILFAIALLAMDPIKNYMIKRGQTQNAIGNITAEQIQKNKLADVSFDWDNIQALNAYDVILQNVNPDDLPTIGAIAIPSVKMNLPIYKGTSEAGMYLGAGTLFEDQEMGVSNYPLASHHSIHEGLLFQPLMNVEYGATVYLTDLENIYEYQIDNIQRVDPTALEVLNPTETPIITLITCDYDLVERVIVQATMVKSVPINEATDDMLAAFELDLTVPE
ncbi:class A sortase [Globicatella sanguinis]